MVPRNRILRRSLDDRTVEDRCRAFDPTELDLAGLPVMLRPLRADDAAGYRDFIARINPCDLRLRFGGDVDAFQRPPFARLAAAEDHVALVATVIDGSRFEIVGDARARIDPHPYGASAEFGIVIRSDLQGLGLGRALLERLIEGCKARGVEQLYGLVAPSNDGMLALARGLGFDVEHVPGGTTVVVSLDLQPRQSSTPRRSGPRETPRPSNVRAAYLADARPPIRASAAPV